MNANNWKSFQTRSLIDNDICLSILQSNHIRVAPGAKYILKHLMFPSQLEIVRLEKLTVAEYPPHQPRLSLAGICRYIAGEDF